MGLYSIILNRATLVKVLEYIEVIELILLFFTEMFTPGRSSARMLAYWAC
jgi:hypothetical protein